MKCELFPFQEAARAKLRMYAATALGNYRSTNVPQVVSYTAPTGAGKTIVMAALIESVYYGDRLYPDQPEAIFVWLSDSPQLNEQSKQKIGAMADRIRLNQCVTVSEESFDEEVLEDGHIYFLNTQKLSKTSKLTRHFDRRQFTIWETLANTVREKSDRLYFVIDEAHRGAQKSSDLARATTIMQKFLKGSPQDKLPPMPVVIGMTATWARFNRLAEGIHSTTCYVETSTEEVRASGLLKDRIAITYPETPGNDMAVLQAAAGEWKDKCEHWHQYCSEQHYAQVNPVFIVQVRNGTAHCVSATDLDGCIQNIEKRTGERFVEGQVVHSFGEGTPALVINGLSVPYVEPSRIADDKRIKVVFFKEALTTGWDCPRAETMMSFRRADDYTYIAQLLGRMVRTPMRQHINVDETLNDVRLFLPQFNRKTVTDVVNAFRNSEGANIPTDIEAEEIGAGAYDTLSLRPTYSISPEQAHRKRSVPVIPGQQKMFSFSDEAGASAAQNQSGEFAPTGCASPAGEAAPLYSASGRQFCGGCEASAGAPSPADDFRGGGNGRDGDKTPRRDIDREAVVRAINNSGLLTYDVRKVLISNYLKSMFDLARFLMRTRIDLDAVENIISDIVEMIRRHSDELKDKGSYKDFASRVMQFEMDTQVFDVFGKSESRASRDVFSTTDEDIERRFRLAEVRLGSEGAGKAYLKKYYDTGNLVNLKIDVILFSADADCMDRLNDFAREKFHGLNDDYRRRTVTLPERYKRKYDSIVSDGDIVSKHNFRLPETIRVPHETEGKIYGNHLFVDDSGTAMIALNGWEQKVIGEEEKQEDFVCWLRNPPRGAWSLCVPYNIDGETRSAYPDFLIVRRDGPDYVVDILEPHNPAIIDNLGKAKGFAEYARQNPGVGRIQLIRMKKDSLGKERIFRLDMSKSSVRDKIFRCAGNEELNRVFDSDGFSM